MRCRTCSANRTERTYYFLAAGAFGRRGGCRLLFPLLLWLAARCRPVFAAAAAFIVALTIVWTTTFSIGMFDEKNFTIDERARAAQAAILAVSLCAIVLASLFSERGKSEARLALSNMMLQRERNNKLISI